MWSVGDCRCVCTVCDFAYDSELRTCMKKECVPVLTCAYDISPFASTSRKRKNRGKWQTCFHSSYEWSIVGLQMTCGHPTACVSLLAPSQLTLCMSRTPNLEAKRSKFLRDFKTWTGLTCNLFCVFHSVIGIAFLALHLLCLLRIVKQGHRPHTIKASTLEINGNYMSAKQFLDTETKAGPAWCLQDFVGHCVVPFHSVLVQPRNAEM